MLENLGRLEDKNRFILIKDNVNQSGHVLLRAILQNSLQESRKVTLILYETPVEYLIPDNKVEHWKQNGLALHQPRLDWWANSSDVAPTKDPFEGFSGGVLIVDSLNPIFAIHSISQLYRLLHKCLLSALVKQVVILAHGDSHEDSQLSPLEHLSSLVISLRPPDPKNPLAIRAELRGNQTGKKLISRHESFTVDTDGKISSKEIEPQEALRNTTLQVDLSDLTFNLGIKDDEAVARNKLVLPYTKVSSEDLENRGEIFYQPDAVDDFDEEDPDNDLNI